MKRLAIKTGEYTDKEGKTKGEYVKVGVILESTNGEYALLDPTVNLAGCLMKQRIMNAGKENKGKGDMVMCAVFTDEPQSAPASQEPAPSSGGGDFNDDVPFNKFESP